MYATRRSPLCRVMEVFPSGLYPQVFYLNTMYMHQEQPLLYECPVRGQLSSNCSSIHVFFRKQLIAFMRSFTVSA